jgi:hypothetical protein
LNVNNANNNINNTHSRNVDRNIDLIDKISILKRSVDKYSDEAKKRIESQILRNTINNDSILSNLTKTISTNKNLTDKGKDTIFKKVHSNKIKPLSNLNLNSTKR